MTQSEFCKYFDKILAATSQYTSLSFAGSGDPLCDVGLEDKVKYAKEQCPELYVPIVTNGYRLTRDRFHSLQDAGIDTIRVSFHGATSESYEAVHRRPYYETVLENVTYALKHKKTIDVTLALVVVPGVNENDVEQWKMFWNHGKVSLLEVWRAHNWVGYYNYREVQEEKLSTCGRVFSGPLQVQVDGTVNMCCMDFNGQLTLGDLKTQSLEEIFNSPMYKKIAECHRTGDYKDSGLICEHCEQRNADKIEACIYSSNYKDIEDRVKRVSTTHERFTD